MWLQFRMTYATMDKVSVHFKKQFIELHAYCDFHLKPFKQSACTGLEIGSGKKNNLAKVSNSVWIGDIISLLSIRHATLSQEVGKWEWAIIEVYNVRCHDTKVWVHFLRIAWKNPESSRWQIVSSFTFSLLFE